MNFCIFSIFFSSLFAKETVIQKFAKMLDGKLSARTRKYTKKLTYIWCIFLFINFLVSVVTIFLPDKIWIIYNGLISYLLVGLMFAVEYPIRLNFKKYDKLYEVLEIFTEKNSDNKPFVISKNKEYTVFEIKKLIAAKIQKIRPLKENIVIFTEDNFVFLINFFACLFTDKNIYLITDRSKFSEMTAEYDVIDNETDTEYNGDLVFEDINIFEPKINFFTSGSTGRAKCVQKSLYNLLSEGIDMGKFLNPENCTFVSTTTMSHLFGMTFHLMLPLCSGQVIKTDKILYPEMAYNENYFLVSTPAFLDMTERQGLTFTKPPKFIVSSGSKLSDKTFAYLEKGSKVTEIYGSSETGVIAYRQHSCDKLQIFPDIHIENTDGRTVVYTKYGYGNGIEIADNLEIRDNKLVIKNRNDRILKIYDKRISAEEIENDIKNSEFAEAAYCFKAEDKLAAFCALSKKGKEFLLENGIAELTKQLKSVVKSDIVPQKWRFSDEIPKTETGKTDKEVIEKIFGINFSFPVILDRKLSENEITYKLFLHKNCNFYKGHFPDFPITPGVAQLFLANFLAGYHFRKDLSAGQYKRIKFSQILKPDSIVFLNLKLSDKYVSYEYKLGEKVCSSGVFSCENIFKGVI